METTEVGTENGSRLVTAQMSPSSLEAGTADLCEAERIQRLLHCQWLYSVLHSNSDAASALRKAATPSRQMTTYY